ncbi:MAG: 2-oxoacid:ferredoxin oxidoreductase subunit beta [Rhodospirillaceae bacterium]|nr:2-oxoacid:ferredoxin oxidoreductase subunit beta [Rhodospirillaceae bacterium]MBT5300106.1 2-oxoacid:ferredoxin oxidoreductase subunit beta [Rhodospirillaceae bacterium]MBT5514670.1 2-oxoacid:ferredoxin oxidoreductase subunit beta [Rhodospirillaceae bacterium]MBT6085217.1 2-oxoacid:ferredoxin oxidoreductase subunit beta [Rhodospirillaceae bacterium]MBT6883796.1 2-oxoacid:ferredoxin oxidoreductase subunit beta [Rhodospirillaceae bacterium]
MNVVTPPEPLKPKDYASDQEVRWCPGCGDYAILRGVQKALSDIGARKENTVFVSGIGCAARFPYYLSTYGFHTIHGRAPAIATGIKITNPELDVWVVSGDGDSLSIGGNHLLHLLRRNVDVQFLLFNNEIYGLTKGQYSPTSRAGTRSPSTPFGSVDKPVSPVAFALGAGARFVARGIDTMQKQLPGLFKRAHEHKGTSFVEIFQNCIVYNDGVFSDFTEKEVAADRQLHLEHGKPMIFGKDRNLGIRLKAGALKLEVVTIGKDSVTEDDLLVHDEKDQMMATLLGGMNGTDMPVAIGILYCDPLPSYEEGVSALAARAIEQAPSADVNELLRHGHTWMVEDA